MKHTRKQSILFWLRMFLWIEGIWNLGDCEWFRRWYGGMWAYCWVDITCSAMWLEDFDFECHPHFEHIIKAEQWS